MKSLMFTGIAATALIAGAPAAFASDSFTGSSSSELKSQIEGTAFGTTGRISGARSSIGSRAGRSISRGRGLRSGGRSIRGNRGISGNRSFRGNRGGGSRSFGSYRTPFYGYILPSYWLGASFGISNYGLYGLNQPSRGYYWSRYYDDAVLRNSAGSVYDYRQNVDWSRSNGAFAPNGYYAAQQPVQQPVTAPTVYHTPQQQPVSGPAIQADSSVYGVNNASTPTGTTDRGVYDGQWTGQYIDEDNRTYRGEWQGQYTNEQGQVYQGTYRGTSVGDPVYTNAGAPVGAPAPVPAQIAAPQQQYAPAPVPQQRAPVQQYAQAPVQAPAQNYQTPGGYESYERCLKGRGIKGGAIGAIVGAVAGNRIAGRGDRLKGSLIGGGVGALAGVGIGKAVDKCERFLPVPQQQQRQQYAPAPQNYRPQPQQYQQQGYGWSQGYYYVPGGYYYPPAQTIVTVTPGVATTTTTVTEEYVDTYVSSGKQLYKPTTKRLRKPGY